MRQDTSGWRTRLNDEMVARYSANGQWSGITLVRTARERVRDVLDCIAMVIPAAKCRPSGHRVYQADVEELLTFVAAAGNSGFR